MANWIKVGDQTNERAGSNYPTQKCVGVLGEDASGGEIPAGSVVLCFTDLETGYGCRRRFFVQNYGSSTVDDLPEWLPVAQITTTKPSSVSFVIVGTKIYAITDVITNSGGATGTTGIYLGEYDLDDGLSGSWTTHSIVHRPEATHNYDLYPDICYIPTNNTLCVAWTDDQVSSASHIINRLYSIDYSAWTPIIIHDIENGGENPRVSVLWAGGEFVYLHVSGVITGGGSTNTSTLYYGNAANPTSNELVAVDLPDAQMCISEAGHVGFLSTDDEYDIVFNYYDPATHAMLDANEEVEGNQTSENFNYGLTFRNGYWQAMYFRIPDSTMHRAIRLEGTAGADTWDEPTAINYENEPIYPDGANFAYLCCQNTPNPAIMGEDFFGTVAVCTDVGASSKYDLWYRGIIITVPADSAGAFDLSLETLAFARRGTGEFSGAEFMIIKDWVHLANDEIVFTDGSSFWQFDPDVYKYGDREYSLIWESHDEYVGGDPFATNQIVPVFESTADFTITLKNENDFVKTASIDSTDSTKEKKIRTLFKKLSYIINHNDDSDVEIQQIDIESEPLEK